MTSAQKDAHAELLQKAYSYMKPDTKITFPVAFTYICVSVYTVHIIKCTNYT